MATELNPIVVYPDEPDTVSIDTTDAPAVQTVPLPVPGVNTMPPAPDVVKQRVSKTQQGLGDILNKSNASLTQDFLDGKEEQVRTQAATTLDYKRAMQRQQDIQNLAVKQKGPLVPEQVLRIMDPFNPANAPADPATVIERAYATNYVGSLNTAAGYMSDTNPLTVAQQDMPKQVDDTLLDGSELLTKNQYILKRMQDIQQGQVQNQSWAGYGADFAKTLFQPYVEYKERGLIGGDKLAGLGLGSNIDEQHSKLYRMPLAEFRKNFDAAMDYLSKDNPQLAVSYAQQMLSQNTFDTALNNTFSALAVPDALAAGKLGVALVKKATAYNQIRRAARDIVESAARDPNATPATRAEGAGNLGEAAVQRTTQNVVNAINGNADPLGVARQSLLTTWKDDAEKFASNPGTYLSREQFTRIMDSFPKDGEDLLNRIVTMNRVERQPLAVTSENVIRAEKDKIRSDYKGPPASFADLEGPIREEASGTYWYKGKLLNYDGEQFSSAETAKGFADQIGLANPIIRGQEADKLYVPEAAIKHLESVKTEGGTTRFYVDHGVEVESSPRPQPGYVPYNLKTNKFEKTLTKESTAIEQQGLGFHIEHWIPRNETDNVLRDLMIKTTGGEAVPEATSLASSATGTKQIINSVLGWVRNSDETLAINESAQRKAVTYTQSNIHQWAKQLGKDLEDIASGTVREDPVTGEKISAFVSKPKAFFGKLSSRKAAQQFERTLDFARHTPDPATGEMGYFFKTAGELQDHYLRNYQRNPSFLETKAYFNYTKLIEGDRVLGEIAEFRNRARVGAEQHQISTVDSTGKEVKSGFFDGMTKKEFPGGDDFILVMGDQAGGETLYKLGNINDKMLKELRRQTEVGEGKVVELYDIDHHPLNGFTDLVQDQRVRYVFSKDVESKPIEFNHVERRGGGHFEWDYDHYLKQANVRPQRTRTTDNDRRPGVEHIYVGDTTVMPIKNRVLGSRVAKLWNEAQEFIKAGDWDSAKPLVAKMGIEWSEFTGWYHPGRDAKGRPTPPRLNPNEPIQVVPKNRNINDLSNALQERYKFKRPDGTEVSTFKDGTKTGAANNFKVAYNTERRTFDPRTINDIGTKDNPIYAHQPAEMVDPIPTMNRALNRAINSTFMDDYKLYGVEHWLREAEPYLNASQAEIRSAPFWHFNNPDWRKGVDQTKIWGLMNNRYKIQSFVGIPSKFDTWAHTFTQNLVDGAYAKYGPEANRNVVQKAITIPPIWTLQHIKDPVDFIRGVTYNFKLGLFAIPQFLVQAQTHALIWSLEPKHGTAGTYAMMLHQWSRLNKSPEIISALDNYATKLSGFGSRFRPGEFAEGMRELEKTGFEHVAGEYANLDNQLKTRFIGNDWDNFLKAGQVPFREGERSTRITAWYTAFREFREANPTTPITNIERSKILNKADLLTVNMSRASSSIINHGVFSLSTQFLSYQVKLAELFFSKRLGETAMDRTMARARIITGFTALYGLPNAMGVTGLPFSDNARETAMDSFGYIPGEKHLSTLLNEGIPAWTWAMISGKGDLQAGVLPNTGDRFGSQGFQQIKQALRSDIPWWQAIGGAGVSTFANLSKSGLDPFYQYALSWARGDSPDQRFRIKSADLVEPLKEISSVSTAAKWWTAMQTGKWVSKNESYVSDVSPLQATLLSLTGQSPQEQDDMFIKNKMIQGETEAQKAALKDFIKDWRRGITAKEQGDDEQGNDYHRNAMGRLRAVGYPYEKVLSAIAIANKGYEKAIDAANERMIRQGDMRKQDQRIEQYKRQLQLNDKRAP